jgi:hypothetical protein
MDVPYSETLRSEHHQTETSDDQLRRGARAAKDGFVVLPRLALTRMSDPNRIQATFHEY